MLKFKKVSHGVRKAGVTSGPSRVSVFEVWSRPSGMETRNEKDFRRPNICHWKMHTLPPSKNKKVTLHFFLHESEEVLLRIFFFFTFANCRLHVSNLRKEGRKECSVSPTFGSTLILKAFTANDAEEVGLAQALDCRGTKHFGKKKMQIQWFGPWHLFWMCDMWQTILQVITSCMFTLFTIIYSIYYLYCKNIEYRCTVKSITRFWVCLTESETRQETLM